MTRQRANGLLGAVALAGCLACVLVVGRSRGIVVGRWPLYGVIVAWTGLSALACGCLVRARGQGRPREGLAVLAVAAALLGSALTSGPQLSDDLYRYLWDAQVAAAGIDPYALPPNAPQLAGLREAFLWPDAAGCTTLRADLPRHARANPFAGDNKRPGCAAINRAGVRTIYPPAAQLALRAGNALTPRSSRELRAQLPAAAYSLALTGLLVGLLRRSGRSSWWALLYAASPLAGLEAAMDAHIDVLGALVGVAALAVLARRQLRARTAALAGALVAVATLVKLYPAALGVVALPRLGVLSRRTLAFVLAGVVTSAALYAPHVAAVGAKVLGYLPGYLAENGYDSGGRYAVLAALGVPGPVSGILVAIGLLALIGWSLRRPFDEGDVVELARRAATVVGVAFLLVTPGNPWYCSLLIGCAALGQRPEWLGVVVANSTVYFVFVLGGDRDWSAVAYAAATALVIAGAVARRRQGSMSCSSLSSSPATTTRPVVGTTVTE